MLKKILLIVVITITSIPSFAINKILILGDSLSAAYRLDPEQGWVALLQKQLNKQAMCYQVVNASIVGETTSGGLNRFPQQLSKNKPDIVVIALGGNDGLRGMPTAFIQQNLQKLIEQSQASQAKVLLLGIKIPPNYGPHYSEFFDNVYTTLADKYDVSVVPFMLEGIATDRRYMQLDRIHPNAKAQPLILEHVWKALRPLLVDC